MPGRSSERSSRDDRHFVTALARGLDVLACFRSSDRMLGNQEIAQRCDLPKSTVSRLTHTLTSLGYLIHVEEAGKYRLGMATFALASVMVARLDVREIASPLMQELADFARAEVSLAMRDQLSMVYLELCRSGELKNHELRVGSRLPIAVTAIGRAWLAGCDEVNRQLVYASLAEREGDAWPALREQLQASRLAYRAEGVASVIGGWRPHVNAIGRPLKLGGGLPTLALSVGGPDFLLPRNRLMELIRPRLIELTAKIEAEMRRRPVG